VWNCICNIFILFTLQEGSTVAVILEVVFNNTSQVEVVRYWIHQQYKYEQINARR